jgi:heme ABC exporter ATP-binding subunit CcmA
MTALDLKGIRKSYGRHAVLKGIDLEVNPGQVVAILGANGSGKSTLLRATGTLTRAEGSIRIAGVDARRNPEAARRHIGQLTQEAPVYADLTVAENLRWWMHCHNVTADVPETLRRAGLLRPDAPAQSLSRGQRQRLALAMALLPPRKVLLLDEPTTALDAAAVAWLESELRARRQEGAAILLALHDEALAARWADRVLRLEGGRLVERTQRASPAADVTASQEGA